MTTPSDHEDEAALRDQNYRFFRDCISTTLVRSTPGTLAEGRRKKKQQPSSSSRSSRRRQQQQQEDEDEARRRQGHYPSAASQQARHARDVEELADFAEYLSAEIFASLPPELQLLTYRTWREAPEPLQSQFSLPITADALSSAIDLPDAVGESLATYGLVAPDPDDLSSPPSSSSPSSLPPSPEAFLIPALTDYITPLTKPPPCSPRSKVTECELCEREWTPLTYHHLIPRFVHDKAVKRGWHRKEDLQNVAWLCRTCHTYIHHVKTHEELARYYYTVDKLLEDEAIFKYAAWISKLT